MITSEFEYAFVWLGSDSARPWGAKADALAEAPHLTQSPVGINLTNIVIGTGETSGTGQVLSVATTLVPDQWIGAQLRLGTTAVPLGGLGDVVANDVDSITVDWVANAASPGSVQGYLVHEDMARAKYDSVRVLTPYQPEGPDVASSSVPYPVGSPIGDVPGFTIPSTITIYEDLGLFLPLSFQEGIASHGISESSDSYTTPAAHPATAADSVSFTITGTLVPDAFAGGFLRVVHDGGLSWAIIDDNDSITFNLTAWSGAGTPTGTPSTWLFEAWVPHFLSSPYSFIPGKGFRYPNNDMQPASEGDGRILNLPRGITSSSYMDRFGSMLEFGWRISQAIGKRVNMIPLAVNDSTLIEQYTENQNGFPGVLGWWNHRIHKSWSLNQAGGLAERLQKLITTIAPGALAAEGNLLPLRILGIVMGNGERDAEIPGGRESYARTSSTFIAWLRKVIRDAQMSPYSAEASIPVIHPRITEVPWQDVGLDENGLTNLAINQVIASDGFASTFGVDDSPKITGDDEHFNGVGEVINGELLALAMGESVDDALEYGSPVVQEMTDPRVTICNLALSHIGDAAEVTTLDGTDTSEQAQRCIRFYNIARDNVLEDHAWSFALKRRVLSYSISAPVQYDYAYVVPPEAIDVLAILPPESMHDYSDPFVLGVFETEIGPSRKYVPVDYTVEQAPAGHRVVFTNQKDAVIRYVARVVDAGRYPQNFVQALSWHLAGLLAGPTVKGQQGAILAEHCMRMSSSWAAKSEIRDAEQQQHHPEPNVSWISAR